MGREDKRSTRFQRSHPGEQNFDLGALEDRGWFVEKNHEMTASVLLERQGFGKFDHLARGEIEIVGAHVRVDFELHLHELAPGRSVERPPVDDAKTGELFLVAEINVFADGEVSEERLLLKYH